MARIHNFSSGPAALPLAVLEQAQAELLDMSGSGMSVMEMSHRSREFQSILDGAESGIRRLMRIPEDYAVLFLHGGASLQFAMVPMNLRRPGRSADYVDTGSWSRKAIKEGDVTGSVHVAWSGKSEGYSRTPKPGELKLMPDAEYVHICSNETIGGVRWKDFPEVATTLVADISSDILSRTIDVGRFGLLYAGAQKNLGPSGIGLVVIRKDLAQRAPESVPIFFRYSTHIADGSLYNTPNTWGVYLIQRTCAWAESMGGVEALEKINKKKAAMLYAMIDRSGFFRSHVERESRSITNIVWRLPSEALEEKFVAEAKLAGMVGLKGHRSVGGIRASIYNAISQEAVQVLASFMEEFERTNG